MRKAGADSAGTDPTDLVVGGALFLFLPLVFYLTAFVIAPAPPQTSQDKAPPDPAPDLEEITRRFEVAEAWYTQNAKAVLALARTPQNPFLDESLRRWAGQSLRGAESAFHGFESFVRKHRESQPALASQFDSYVARSAARREELARDLAWVDGKDAPGRP